jgi:ribulose-5-phosphate 4-epimerase/fuculose-1-phosphate aldolase
VTTDELRARVATACRLIAMEGFTDLTLGHVSARHPGERTVWIKRKGLALDEVEPDDVIALDLDDPDAFANRDYHLESVMHTEVYRARPDVNAVIHGHPLYGTALGATDGTLRYLTHDAVLFTDGLGIYDDGPALVTERSQATRVAAALGSRRAALLRNHGVVVAGEDLRWAVLTAVTLERAVRFQVIAASLGAPHPITQSDAEVLRPMKYQEFLLDDYWAAWERRVARARAHEAPAPLGGRA